MTRIQNPWHFFLAWPLWAPLWLLYVTIGALTYLFHYLTLGAIYAAAGVAWLYGLVRFGSIDVARTLAERALE